MVEEIDRLTLGRVKGLSWLDDQTVLVASTAGLYRTDVDSLEWTLLGECGYDLSISQDRSRAAVALENPRRPRVISLVDGSVIWEAKVPMLSILRNVSISADGKTVAWGDGKEFVHFVDIDSGIAIRSLSIEESFSGCQGVRFLTDGHVVTWNSDGLVQVWDGDEEVHRWKNHRWVRDVLELPDRRLLLAAKPNSAINRVSDGHIWVRERDGTEVVGITPVKEFGYVDDQQALALSPDGQLAASAGNDSALYLLGTSDWEQIACIPLKPDGHDGVHKWPGYAVEFSPDGKKIAVLTGSDANVGSASFRHSLQIFDLKGTRLSCEDRYLGVVHDISFGSGTIAVAHEWGIDLHAPDGSQRCLSSMNAVAMALSPDCTHLVACMKQFEGTVELIEVATGTVVATPKVNKKRFKAAVFSPDNLHYAIAGEYAQVFKIGQKSAVKKRKEDVRGLAFSADGSAFAECSRDGTTLVRKGKKFPTAHTFKNPSEQRTRGPYTFPATGLAFSPDGQRIAIASGDGTRIMNLESGIEERLLNVVEGEQRPARSCVAWSTDGVFLAEGNRKGTIRLWDTTCWESVAVIQHTDEINTLVFGDNVLLSASADGSVRCFGLAVKSR